MAVTRPVSPSTTTGAVSNTVGILLGTVVPGTILAVVGSFLKWYDREGFEQKGTELAGVLVTTLAIDCLLAALAFIGSRARPPWLLGIIFVLALVPGAEAGNYVAMIEQTDGAATAEGLYIVLIGLGLAVFGSASAFLLASFAVGADQAVALPSPLAEGEPPAPNTFGK